MNELAFPPILFFIVYGVFYNSLLSIHWILCFTRLSGEVSTILRPADALGSFLFMKK